MNYKKKRKEASKVIEHYLSKKKTMQELYDYSWKEIYEFSSENQHEQLMNEDGSVFWFAIWQIQHLASEEHFKDGSLKRELKQTLKYLLDQTPLPQGVYGLPPTIKAKKINS